MKPTTSVLCLLCLLNLSASAQWMEANGPYGGSVTALLDVNDYLFAGAGGGGVFLSVNSGESWGQVSEGLPGSSVNALTISNNFLFTAARSGVYRSSNNGTSWVEASAGLTGTFRTVRTFAAMPDGDGGTYLFAGTAGGVARTNDDGASWTPLNSPSMPTNIWALAVLGAKLFTGGNNGVHVTANNGADWVPAGLQGTWVRGLAISGQYLFAATINDGVFRTDTQEVNWMPVHTGSTTEDVRCINATQAGLYAGTYGSGVFRSTDHGDTWTPVNTGLYHRYIIALTSGESGLFAGTNGGGVFHSSNSGDMWTEASFGITGISTRSFVTFDGDLFVGTAGGVFQWDSDNARWTRRTSGMTNPFVHSLHALDTTLVAATFGGGVFISADKGLTWSSANNGLTSLGVFALASSDTILFAGTSPGGIFRSTDNGNQWVQVNNGLLLSNVRCLAATQTHVFAGAAQTQPGLYISSNRGEHWELSALNGLVNTITPAGTRIFAGLYGGGVNVSDNNGATWTSANTGITQSEITSFAVFSPHIFAGAGQGVFGGPNGGVFHSSNNGASWVSVGGGLPDALVTATFVHDGDLFAGVSNRGLWKRPLSDIVTSVAQASEDPLEFRLLQNYPNPFNPATNIRFHLATTVQVSINIHDVLGREIATLIDGMKQPGDHSLQWNASGFATGVYFCRLVAGDFVDVKKLMVLK